MGKKTNTKKDNTGFRNGDLFCFNCGTSQKLPLPMDAGLASDWMMAFSKRHKSCPKTWSEPQNSIEGKTEAENEKWWLTNGEHGTSSKTMYNHLTDGVKMNLDWQSTTSDPSDFRRCHLLLEAVPQYRNKLDKMKPISRTWSNLVDNWAKLTEMLLEQMRTKKANGMYELMKKLGC